MKGSVIWESKAHGEVLEGKVTRCVPQDQGINVVFDCTDLGEGQITFTDKEGQQVLTSRFLYYGQQEATRVNVRGVLNGRPGAIVFEGAWTDPLDGTGEWQFFLEVEGIDGLAVTAVHDNPNSVSDSTALTRLAANLAPNLFTEQYGFDVDPARPGIYRVREVGQLPGDSFRYSWWDGAGWGRTESTIERVLKQHIAAQGEQSEESRAWVTSWYGLTEDGWRAMMAQL